MEWSPVVKVSMIGLNECQEEIERESIDKLLNLFSDSMRFVDSLTNFQNFALLLDFTVKIFSLNQD